MNSEAFEQWFKASKNLNIPNIPLGNWNKNATQAFNHILENNLKCIGECVANTQKAISSQLKCLSSTNPENLLNAQKECINEGISTAVTNMQKIINTALENLDEFTMLYSNREQMSATKPTEKTGR